MFKAFGLFWKNFSQAKGRTGRKNFWLAMILQIIICAVLGVAAYFIMPVRFVLAVYALVCLVPSFAIEIRRLHDINKKGSSLFLMLIPIVGAIILFVRFLRKGNEGENGFGAPEGAPETTPDAQQNAQNPEAAAPPADGFVIPPIYRSDAPQSASPAYTATGEPAPAATNVPAYTATGEPATTASFTTPGGSTAYTPGKPAEAPAPQPVTANASAYTAASAPYTQAEPATAAYSSPSSYAPPVYGYGNNTRDIYTGSPDAPLAEPAVDEIPLVTPEPVPADEVIPPQAAPIQETYYTVPQKSLYDMPVYAYKPASYATGATQPQEQPQQAQEAQPEPAAPVSPASNFKPRGYKTKGFPYGH